MEQDDFTRMIAAFDQLGSMLGTFAPVLTQYVEALEESGLDREEAITFARDWHRMVWRHILWLQRPAGEE